jgi:hypothetical protein
MLPKIRSFPQQLIANLRVSEATVSERCGMLRLRLGALLVLICFAALQPSKGFSESLPLVSGEMGPGHPVRPTIIGPDPKPRSPR